MGTATGDIQITTTLRAVVPGRAAATATLDTPVARVPKASTVAAVRYFPDTAVTGADTNSLTLSLINKGTDGNGTTNVATKAFTSGVDMADFDQVDLTLSGTAANLDAAEGAVLAWRSEKVGTGLEDPGGLVEIDIKND